MKHLKKYKLFESLDSDLEDIKDVMNDIPDSEDIGIYFEEDDERIKINIYPLCISGFFKVNQNIKSIIQRLNHLYKNDYTFLYQYMDGSKWSKFYVYDDERGLRDYDTIKLDGSGKFPAPKIYRMLITMVKK
jgi:hypothetical protein